MSECTVMKSKISLVFNGNFERARPQFDKINLLSSSLVKCRQCRDVRNCLHLLLKLRTLEAYHQLMFCCHQSHHTLVLALLILLSKLHIHPV